MDGGTPWYAVLKERAMPKGECSRMNGQDVYVVKTMVEQRQRELRQDFVKANTAGGPTVPGLALGIITALLVALLGR